MNISNLALVFGPTLMPAPKDDMGAMLRDAITINTLMSDMIEHHEYLFGDNDDLDFEDGETEDGETKDDDGYLAVGDEPLQSEVIEHATVLHDYEARNDTEMSLVQGTRIDLFCKVNANWWDARYGENRGYIPNAYIQVDGDVGSPTATAITPDADSTHRHSPLIFDAGPPEMPRIDVQPSYDDEDGEDPNDSMLGLGFPSPSPEAAPLKSRLHSQSFSSSLSRSSSFGPSFAPPLPPTSKATDPEALPPLPTTPFDGKRC